MDITQPPSSDFSLTNRLFTHPHCVIQMQHRHTLIVTPSLTGGTEALKVAAHASWRERGGEEVEVMVSGSGTCTAQRHNALVTLTHSLPHS